jgi:hypothetical protein
MGSVLFRLFLLASISVISGVVFNTMGLSFYLGLFFGMCIQFVINYVIDRFVDSYVELKNKALENDRIREFSYQGVEVKCPCHKQIKQLVPFRFNTDNRYKCNDCQKTITVLVEPFTAIATEPIADTDTTKPEIISNAKLE